MSEWIDVSDRLPGFPIPVLVCYQSEADGEPCVDAGVAMLHPDGVWRGAGVFYQLGQQQKYAIRECVKSSVTHWQPFPDPPEFQP